MSAARYLAFDLGASGGKAVLGTLEGQRLTLEGVYRFPNGPTQICGRLHWNVVGLFHEVVAGLSRAAERAPRLDGIGIDTWGVDYALLSASGELLGLPYHYRDARTAGMMEEAFRHVPRAEIYRATGIQFMALNTVYQLMAASRREPELLESAARLLFMPDLLHYWLTGVAQSEYTIASTSQLFRADGTGWASELIEALGLPRHIFPPVVPPGTFVGPLLDEVRASAALEPTTVIAPACHDTAVAVAAVPASRENWAYLSSGTWSLLGVELDRPICSAAALAHNFTNEGGIAGTRRFLTNAAGLWLVQECRRAWTHGDDAPDYSELADMAARAPALRCLVDPDDPCFAAPGDMPSRIREYCGRTGQSPPDNRGAIVRCVLDSLALKYAHNLRVIEEVTGRAVEVVHVVGGGARNELLCQLTADALERPVVTGPAEAAAVGNVLIQALATGRISSIAEGRAIVAGSTELRTYEPQPNAAWREARGRFEALR